MAPPITYRRFAILVNNYIFILLQPGGHGNRLTVWLSTQPEVSGSQYVAYACVCCPIHVDTDIPP